MVFHFQTDPFPLLADPLRLDSVRFLKNLARILADSFIAPFMISCFLREVQILSSLDIVSIVLVGFRVQNLATMTPAS